MVEFVDGAQSKHAEDCVLQWVGATVWPAGEPEQLDLLSPETATELRSAVERDRPVWLQFGFPSVGELTAQWFEGSVSVWDYPRSPRIGWDGLEEVLDAVGLQAPSPTNGGDGPGARLLGGLPYVYAQGIFRAAKDAYPEVAASGESLLFPALGFLPETPAGDASPRFLTLRLNVALIDKVVITVRLPDQLCDGQPETRYRTGLDVLPLPRRFLPFRPPTARDVAEGIALHQASTTRAVSDRLRDLLRAIDEETASSHSPVPEPEGQRDEQERQQAIHVMTEIAFQVDRQISRLLRRFGSQGGDGRDEARQLAPPEVKLSYRFALDEIRSFDAERQLTETRIDAEISAYERDQRERFQSVAAFVAALIVIPTLVAGVYGANVPLPGGDSWAGFAALILFLFGFAGLGSLGLNWALSREELHETGWFAPPTRLAAAVCGVLVVAGGLLVWFFG